jgi:hypothetical protein
MNATTIQTRHLAHESIKPDKNIREQQCLDILRKFGPYTGHQVARHLHIAGQLEYPMRSIIQPRLTELVGKGIIEVVGTKIDPITHRKCAVYDINPEYEWIKEATEDE